MPPIGDSTDFKIYSPQFFAGMQEGIERVVEGFGEASANALQLTSRQIEGDFETEALIQRVSSGIVSHRDPTDTSTTVPDAKLTMDELIGVKVNRRIGPVAGTLDAWRKMGKDPSEFSLRVGAQTGDDVAIDWIDTALRATLATIKASSGLVSHIGATGTGKVEQLSLNDAFALFGDRSSRILLLAMHSQVWHGLIGESLTNADNIFEIAGATVREGTVATQDRRVLVIDSPALVMAAVAIQTSVAANGTNETFDKTGIGTNIQVGQYVLTAGFTNAENNGTFRVTAVAADSLTVDGDLTTETATAGKTLTGLVTYSTLGLVPGACEVAKSEGEEFVNFQIEQRKPTLIGRLQGEYAVNVRTKASAFDKSKVNPTDLQLADPANWNPVMADLKAMAGIAITSL